MFSIQVYDYQIGSNSHQTISGREMHSELQIKYDFSTWVRDQIKRLQLIENIDYTVIQNLQENPQGGRPRTEYYFTIDIAKHIALASHTPKGRLYRQALIDLEKQVYSISNYQERPTQIAIGIAEDFVRLAEIFGAPKSVALIEAKKSIDLLGINVSSLLQSSTEMDDIQDEDVYLEPTELAEQLGVKNAREMNKILEGMGLQSKINKTWVATDKADSMCSRHQWSSERSTKSGYNYKWRLSAIQRLMSQYLEAGVE